MPDTRLRICLVAPLPPPYGGMSHWTSLLCRYAAKRDDVQLRVLNTAPRWRAIDDLTVWKRVIGGGIQLLRDFILFIGILITQRPHAVHITTAGEMGSLRDLIVTFTARIFHVPVCYHIKFGRVPLIAKNNTWEWRLMALVMAKSYKVIAIDMATQNAISQYLPKVALERIPNSFNPDELPQKISPTSSERTAVYLGWVIPTKGIDELLDSWSRLQPDGWRLVIIGPGDQAYQQKVMDKHRPLHVDFLGELPHRQAMEQLSKADLFVFPSYTEGFPNVILEAMALGKAIVTTRVGAIPEMLIEGCGILVDPQDATALTTALGQVLGDANLRAEMGGRAYKRAMAEFSIEAIFAKYMSLWRQAAGLYLEQKQVVSNS